MSQSSLILAPVPAHIGPQTVVDRLLPQRALRRIGAWVFLDAFGPVPAEQAAMTVDPHPHIGLQTATWLFEGEVLHTDSLGTRQVICPGQLNLMTSGRGIAHTEDLVAAPRGLHGVQLWIALPEALAAIDPSFQHIDRLPRVDGSGWSVVVAVGSLLGAVSPAKVHSALVLAQADLSPGARLVVPWAAGQELGVLLIEGDVEVDGENVPVGSLAFLGSGRTEVEIGSARGARVMVLGGEPLDQPVFMSWNWVASSRELLDDARERWARGEGYGDLAVFGSRERIPAPVGR
jgi:redox-sensitive bicupin YhaK (pirin superfamily)